MAIVTIRSQRSGPLVRARKWIWRYQHSPVVRRQLVVRLGTLTVLVAILLAGLFGLAAARQARNEWGDTQSIYRFVDDLYAGDLVDANVVEQVDVPLHLVPPGAVSTIPPMSRVVARVGHGEFVTAQRLHLGNNGSLTHHIPSDHSLVTITFPVRSVVLHPGDVVSLFDTSHLANSVWGPGVQLDHAELSKPTRTPNSTNDMEVLETAQLVAPALAVIHVDSDQAQFLVSVPNEDLPVITAVIARGQFTVALAGSATPICDEPGRC